MLCNFTPHITLPVSSTPKSSIILDPGSNPTSSHVTSSLNSCLGLLGFRNAGALVGEGDSSTLKDFSVIVRSVPHWLRCCDVTLLDVVFLTRTVVFICLETTNLLLVGEPVDVPSLAVAVVVVVTNFSLFLELSF